MTEFHSPSGPLPDVPDDSTLPQFFLDSQHPTRPIREEGIPWLIEDATGRKVGYEELRSRTYGLANALSLRYKIKENDTVFISSPNHLDYPVAIWASHRLGAVVSCANPAFAAEEVAYQLEITKATFIFTHSTCVNTCLSSMRMAGLSPSRIATFDLLAKGSHKSFSVDQLVSEGLRGPTGFVERRLERGEARTKVAFLTFSSGTTGKPKAVAIPHFAIIANVLQMATHQNVSGSYSPVRQQRYRPGDVAIAVIPFFHVYGLVINMHFMLFSAMSLVVIPKFRFEDMLKSIVRHRITHLLLVPPQAILLCKHVASKDYDLSHVRFVLCGAAPLTEEIYKQLHERFPGADVGQGYGMTETATTLTLIPTDQKRGTLGSAGQLLAGIIARVIKPDGTLADFGEPGELVVKTPAAALGYLNDAKATAQTFIDGWIYTGDKVLIDRNSEVFIIDRIKEFLKVRGFQVAPAELEGVLLGHPDVSDACVVGVQDEYSGEIPLAFVALAQGARARAMRSSEAAEGIKDAIIKHVAKNKAPYKHLTGGVVFVDEVPRNPSGKLLRRLLRDQAKQTRGSSSSSVKNKL